MSRQHKKASESGLSISPMGLLEDDQRLVFSLPPSLSLSASTPLPIFLTWEHPGQHPSRWAQKACRKLVCVRMRSQLVAPVLVGVLVCGVGEVNICNINCPRTCTPVRELVNKIYSLDILSVLHRPSNFTALTGPSYVRFLSVISGFTTPLEHIPSRHHHLQQQKHLPHTVQQ